MLHREEEEEERLRVEYNQALEREEGRVGLFERPFLAPPLVSHESHSAPVLSRALS